MQRLFSTFPEGWPGAGLAFLRVVAVITLFPPRMAALMTASLPALVIPQFIVAGTAALLLIGLWTPVAGVTMATAELCLMFSDPTDLSAHILLGALGAAMAMLGPGAWSVDARWFGRKRIQIPPLPL